MALSRIEKFAAETPFSIQELTAAFVQLANRGITPSTETLTAMGDLASALGKPLQQVNEAVLDVTNSERWTELGIKVKVNGDKITGTFRGMTVSAERSEKGALQLVEAFGKMANLATKAAVEGSKMTIHAPLINLSKQEIVQRGMSLSVDYSLTVSCYQADKTGLACGVCDACRIRRAGFEKAGIIDPTRYRK